MVILSQWPIVYGPLTEKLLTGTVSSPLMNYLAHLALSPAHDDILFGNYIADSIRPKQRKNWTAEMIQGYELHIDIDQATDRNLAFREVKNMLKSTHQKYAPVVLDILNDHLLALNWDKIFNTNFDNWNQDIYKRLEPFQAYELPPKAQKLLDGLLDHRYLYVYASQAGTEDVLIRMDRRAKFPSNFVAGITDLYSNFNLFEELFYKLFADLCREFPPAIELQCKE